MRMEFSIGDQDPVAVVLERNWWSGRFTCSAGGVVHQIRSSRNPGTHFDVRTARTYTVELGTDPVRTVTIEHRRPRLFGGLRPQEYRVMYEGNVVGEYQGY